MGFEAVAGGRWGGGQVAGGPAHRDGAARSARRRVDPKTVVEFLLGGGADRGR